MPVVSMAKSMAAIQFSEAALSAHVRPTNPTTPTASTNGSVNLPRQRFTAYIRPALARAAAKSAHGKL